MLYNKTIQLQLYSVGSRPQKLFILYIVYYIYIYMYIYIYIYTVYGLFLRPRPWQFDFLRFEIMKTDRMTSHYNTWYVMI